MLYNPLDKVYYNKSLISSTIVNISAVQVIIKVPLHKHFPLLFDTSVLNAPATTFRQLSLCNLMLAAAVCNKHICNFFSQRCTNLQEEMLVAEIHILFLLTIRWLFCQKNLHLNSKTSFNRLFIMQCARDQRGTKQILELKKIYHFLHNTIISMIGRLLTKFCSKKFVLCESNSCSAARKES